MDMAAIITIASKGLLSLALAGGGIYAIYGGIKLFLDGVGIVRDGTTVHIKRKELNIKVTASSVGALLFLTASAWGYIAYLALPSLHYDPYGPVVGLLPPPVVGPALGSQEDLVVRVGDRIFFDLNSGDLRPPAQHTLQMLAAWMAEYSDGTITIEGHADEPGTREYNLALAERRANSVRDYLIAAGVNGNRLATISYGKERPAVLGSIEEAWAQNRRSVFVVN